MEPRHRRGAHRLRGTLIGNCSSYAAAALVEELCVLSNAFLGMWREQEVGFSGKSPERIEHPTAGPIKLVYATFAVDEQPSLGLVVFTPVTSIDAASIRELVQD